jgi:transcriptional regulator with XRE-family HTH domain
VTTNPAHGATPPPASPASRATERRTELAGFLRTRRERIGPQDAGLPPGSRRRTAGLRREEVAQLAGVGVTWYTWLEQGRPINASTQVLDAIARTLKLDPAERVHLFRLAGVPGSDTRGPCPQDCPLPPEVQDVLDAFTAVPASVINERFDLLAWNDLYATIYPRVTSAPASERNTLLATLTTPPCCNPAVSAGAVCDCMIGQLRAGYGRHVGDPAWTHFIRTLHAASPAFAQTWAGHDVAPPMTNATSFRHPGAGTVRVTTTSFAVSVFPDARMIVCTPADEESRIALDNLAAGIGTDTHFPCWPAHQPQHAALTGPG